MQVFDQCNRCGGTGHWARECETPVADLPKPPAGPAICLHCGLPGHQGCGQPVADYEAAATRARELLNMPRPAVVRSEFRARYGIPARSEEEYRAIARQQVAEFRAQRIAL